MAKEKKFYLFMNKEQRELMKREELKRELESTNNITVAQEGYSFNTKYDYAEIFGGGIKNSEDSVIKSARMTNLFNSYIMTIAEKGKMVVESNYLGPFECDAILRDIKSLPCKHLYFNNGKFTGYQRKFTPSMYGGNPLDREVIPSEIEGIVNKAMPLIRRMELEAGREIVNKN